MAYAVIRWVVRPHVAQGFWHDQATDVLLIPAALPLLLWGQRRLRLRHHDRPPEAGEILLHLVVWSVLCEVIGPRFWPVIGDWKDVVAYSVGATFAWWWWGEWERVVNRRDH